MATTVINPPVRSSGQIYPTTLPRGNSSTNRNTNEFFFYSNSPETIQTSHLADNGKWLNMGGVSGNGQIYTWHYNATISNLKALILVYNPNSYDITISVSNYGITNLSYVVPDCAAWEDYMKGIQTKTVNVEAGGFSTLFEWNSISTNRVFGVVARASIKRKNTSTSASAVLYDIAYTNRSDTATAFATASSGKHRGTGNGYYQYVTFDEIVFGNESTYKGYMFAANDSVFGGSECSTIYDSSTGTSSNLVGGYGQIFNITMKIKNNTNFQRTFNVFVGSMGGVGIPFVNIGSDIVYRTGYTQEEQSGHYYNDVIRTGPIAANSSETLGFSMVIPAVSSTAFVIGARPI